jgi:two-component system response regulator NreC
MADNNGHDAKPRLLVVDDHCLVRQGLLLMFRATGGFEAAASGLHGSVGRAQGFRPHVVLFGLAVPVTRTLEVAESVAAAGAGRLLVLDDRFHSASLDAAIQAGAYGYWTKHVKFDQLLCAVQDVLDGKRSFCPAARENLVWTQAGLRVEPSANGSVLARLTRRESEVMALLAKGLSVRQCAAQLDLAPSTIDNHKSRMMRKLGVHKVTEVVRLAISEGMLCD